MWILLGFKKKIVVEFVKKLLKFVWKIWKFVKKFQTNFEPTIGLYGSGVKTLEDFSFLEICEKNSTTFEIWLVGD